MSTKKNKPRNRKIGKRFKDLRIDFDVDGKYCTQDKLGKLINIQKPQISALENGRAPSIAELKAYSKFFNVPIEYLLGESNSRHYENIDTNKKLGLSDSSIEALKFIIDASKNIPQDRAYTELDVLNYIISYKKNHIIYLLADIIAYLNFNETKNKEISNSKTFIENENINIAKGGLLYLIQHRFMNIIEDMKNDITTKNKEG